MAYGGLGQHRTAQSSLFGGRDQIAVVLDGLLQLGAVETAVISHKRLTTFLDC